VKLDVFAAQVAEERRAAFGEDPTRAGTTAATPAIDTNVTAADPGASGGSEAGFSRDGAGNYSVRLGSGNLGDAAAAIKSMAVQLEARDRALDAATQRVGDLEAALRDANARAAAQTVDLAATSAQLDDVLARASRAELEAADLREAQRGQVAEAQGRLLETLSTLKSAAAPEQAARALQRLSTRVTQLEGVDAQLDQLQHNLALARADLRRSESARAQLENAVKGVSNLFLQFPRSRDALERLLIERNEAMRALERAAAGGGDDAAGFQPGSGLLGASNRGGSSVAGGGASGVFDMRALTGAVELKCLEAAAAREAAAPALWALAVGLPPPPSNDPAGISSQSMGDDDTNDPTASALLTPSIAALLREVAETLDALDAGVNVKPKMPRPSPPPQPPTAVVSPPPLPVAGGGIGHHTAAQSPPIPIRGGGVAAAPQLQSSSGSGFSMEEETAIDVSAAFRAFATFDRHPPGGAARAGEPASTAALKGEPLALCLASLGLPLLGAHLLPPGGMTEAEVLARVRQHVQQQQQRAPGVGVRGVSRTPTSTSTASSL
jgi:hypothetical protein